MSFQPIENYGVIGNMRSIALVGMHGSIDFLCYPDFDSLNPSYGFTLLKRYRFIPPQSPSSSPSDARRCATPVPGR